jgi:hypothetical protein
MVWTMSDQNIALTDPVEITPSAAITLTFLSDYPRPRTRSRFLEEIRLGP